jgi:NADP-dependent 3-hydroxy acid dehydrogenase YdfG
MSSNSVLNSIDGRVAVITGASSGIGENTARALAARGAKVALLARRKDKLETIAAEITAAGGTALVVPVDVTDAEAMTAAAATVKAQLGSASIVFNNAGIMLPAAIEEHRTDQWQHQIDLNIGAAMHTIGAFHDQLAETAAASGRADLINTSSIAAQNIFPNFAVYSATKAFITHLSRTLRTEYGPKGIRVSAIEPGIVSTELQSHVTDAGTNEWLAGARQSMNLLEGADIAEVVAFIVSLPAHVNLQQVTIMPTQQPS